MKNSIINRLTRRAAGVVIAGGLAVGGSLAMADHSHAAPVAAAEGKNGR